MDVTFFYDILEMIQNKHLRLERGGRLQVWVSCACFLINLLCPNVLRHNIHQIKARYLIMFCVKLYDVKSVRNKKKYFFTFIF